MMLLLIFVDSCPTVPPIPKIRRLIGCAPKRECKRLFIEIAYSVVPVQYLLINHVSAPKLYNLKMRRSLNRLNRSIRNIVASIDSTLICPSRNLLTLALLCVAVFFSQCTKRTEGDRRPIGFEQDILGKWKLASSSYSGYWVFKSNVIDSLSTRSRTVRELEIHINGFCAGKGYWSLTNDSILDNSCIPNAKLIKLTKDSLLFKFSQGWFEIEYKWHR